MPVKETVEQFVARGGKINKVEYQEPQEEAVILKHKPHFTTDLISLGEAEFYFGEHKSKQKTPKNLEKFKIALESAELPEKFVEIINATEQQEIADEEQ